MKINSTDEQIIISFDYPYEIMEARRMIEIANKWKETEFGLKLYDHVSKIAEKQELVRELI